VRHVNTVLAVLVTLAGIAVSNPASAQFQLGLQVGRVHAEALCSGVPGGLGITCSEVDNTVPRGFVGYQFSRNWGIEGGVAGGEAGASGTQTIKATVWDAFVVGTLPISSRFDLYGKVGMYYARIKESDQVLFGVVTKPGRSEKDSGFAMGAGFQYNVNRNIALRAEVGLYQELADVRDLTAFSVAALWRFQ